MSLKKIKNSGFWFLVIFTAAALFRLTNLDLIEFKADEATNLFLASRPLFGHPFPPGGTVSSIGLLNPPLLNYLLFPFVAISLNPKIISFFIALLNSLAIGFFFLLIRHYYNHIMALIASLLLAFSPWSILFSRKIWPQDLILPFFIFLLYGFHKIKVDKKMNWWIVYTAVSLFLLQLHQVNLIFLVILTAFLILQGAKINIKFISLGFFLGFLPLIPYLAYLINNLSDPQVFLVAKGRFSQEYFPLIFFRPLQIISQGNFRFILGDDIFAFAQKFPLVFNLRKLFYFEYLFLPLGVLIFWKKFTQFRSLVYTTLSLPLIYFFLHFQPFIHYFIVLLPLLSLFLANSFTFLLSRGKILRSISILLLFLLLITSVSFNLAFFNLLSQKKALKGDYGITFTQIEKETKTRLSAYQNDPGYQEMLLASFLPMQYWYGYLPVPQMLYQHEETKAHLNELEARLKTAPIDTRVQLELLAFYTQSPPTPETLALLKEKTITIPGYQPVYDGVYKVFLEQNP